MAGGELRRLCGDGLGRAERLNEAEESAGEAALGVCEEENSWISLKAGGAASSI